MYVLAFLCLIAVCQFFNKRILLFSPVNRPISRLVGPYLYWEVRYLWGVFSRLDILISVSVYGLREHHFDPRPVQHATWTKSSGKFNAVSIYNGFQTSQEKQQQ